MDEQIKKPISQTIMVAIEKAPLFPLFSHHPPNIKEKNR